MRIALFSLIVTIPFLSCGGANGTDCNGLLNQMRQIQASSNSCQQDSDCVAIQGQPYGCGSGLCGAGINASAKAQLDTVANEYFANCGGPCAACPVGPVTMKCSNGTCVCGETLCN